MRASADSPPKLWRKKMNEKDKDRGEWMQGVEDTEKADKSGEEESKSEGRKAKEWKGVGEQGVRENRE